MSKPNHYKCTMSFLSLIFPFNLYNKYKRRRDGRNLRLSTTGFFFRILLKGQYFLQNIHISVIRDFNTSKEKKNDIEKRRQFIAKYVPNLNIIECANILRNFCV